MMLPKNSPLINFHWKIPTEYKVEHIFPKFALMEILFYSKRLNVLQRQRIVTTEKKIYCDLILTNENDTFIQFLQDLEKAIQTLIYEKRNIWFHNDMEMENIEYFFSPLVRTYKKKFLVRTYIQQPKHIKSTKSLQIYDENENRLTIQDVKKDNKVIAILEGLGIKFTSSSFHLELCLRQAMVLEDKPIFQKCLIQMRKPGEERKNNLDAEKE